MDSITMNNNNAQIQSVKQQWSTYNQEHVFNWTNKLDDAQRAMFLNEVEQIDVADVDRIYKATVAQEEAEKNGSHDIKPFNNVITFSQSTAEDRARWQQIGYQLIAENKVGVLLLAGGQASRLGCAQPKGMFDLGLPSKKSLYQMQVERSVRLTQLAAQSQGVDTCAIPWYIMTSPATYDDTVKHFKENNYFGLPGDNFFFFNQGVQPCLTPEGKIIPESSGKIALAPNGNGGLYKALHTSGALADMQRRGLEYIAQHCVDNALIRVADPAFVGYMHEQQADCAAKVVPKAYPEEQVGVMALIDGKPGVVEYSEITPAMRNSRDETDTLVYNYSHICINNFSVRFLQEIASNYLEQLKFHIARKKIPFANEEGVKTTATKENGWKLEMFIFDAFQFSKKMVGFECIRNEEFSPLKNGYGAGRDCPETCLEDIVRVMHSYIEKAGGEIDSSPNGASDEQVIVEVSPLTSYAGEGLEFVKGRTFSNSFEITGKFSDSFEARRPAAMLLGSASM